MLVKALLLESVYGTTYLLGAHLHILYEILKDLRKNNLK